VVRDLYDSVEHLRRNWQVFAFSTEKVSPQSSPLLELEGPDAQGRFALDYTFAHPPKQLGRLRIDSPAKAWCRLVDFQWELESGGQPVDANPPARPGYSRGFTDDGAGGYWIQRDMDPQQAWDFAKAPELGDTLTVRFRFGLLATLPEAVVQRLADEGLRAQVQSALNKIMPGLGLETLMGPPSPGARQ
ncbi:MAG TPA: hypothetical protein PLJ12_09110, partial [Planctomycetota bacterium]|nr:hypothetical protein [Planctomycetota bacterium]